MPGQIELDMDWIHSWIGFNCIGWDDCNPYFLISNHFSAVDAIQSMIYKTAWRHRLEVLYL